MPEGDTVWLAARRMHDAFAGTVLTRTDFRVPRLATVDLTGRTVTEVVPRGKHMLTRVAGDLTLHTHFRMDGAWHLYRAGERWRGGPAHQVRLVLGTAAREAVGYRLHDIALVSTAEEDRLVGHLGPDVLGPDWDAEEAVRRLRTQPDRPLGAALLDQRHLAGVGNLYRNETLFLCGLPPDATVADAPDLRHVVDTAHRLMQANKGRWEQTTTGETAYGRMHWVFERHGRPCLRCGTPVRRAEQRDAGHDRLVYWCPRCQPAAG